MATSWFSGIAANTPRPNAHLSRFAPACTAAQGGAEDTIGFGRPDRDGPPRAALHYEFRIAGQARNPFSIAMRPVLPLPAQDLAAFQYYASPLMARLDLLANSNLAQLE